MLFNTLNRTLYRTALHNKELLAQLNTQAEKP